MSIITETLQRMQAGYDRTGLASKDRAPDPVSPTFFPTQPQKTAQSRVRRVGWVIGGGLLLVALGMGGYFWGLSLVPETSAPRTGLPLPPVAPESPSGSTIENRLEEPPISAAPEKTRSPLASEDVGEIGEEAIQKEPSRLPKTPSDAIPGEGLSSSSAMVQIDESLPSSTPLAEPEDENGPEVRVNYVPSMVVPADPLLSPVSPSLQTSGSSNDPPLPVAESPPAAQAEPVVSGNPPPAPPKAEPLMAARRLISQSRYQEALPLLQAVKETASRNWQFWMWLGIVRLGLGELEAADQALLEGLAREGTVAQLWIQRALVAQQQGRYEAAVSFLLQAEILAPELPELLLNFGYTFERQGQVDSAVRYYRKFLALTEGQSEYVAVRKKIFARLAQVSSGP